MNNEIEKELEKYPIPEENIDIFVRKYMVDENNKSYDSEETVEIKVPELTEEQKELYEKENKERQEKFNINRMQSIIAERFEKDFYYFDGYKENGKEFAYVYIDTDKLLFLNIDNEYVTININNNMDFLDNIKNILINNLNEKDLLYKSENPFVTTDKKIPMIECILNGNKIELSKSKHEDLYKKIVNLILDEIEKFLKK